MATRETEAQARLLDYEEVELRVHMQPAPPASAGEGPWQGRRESHAPQSLRTATLIRIGSHQSHPQKPRFAVMGML